MVNVIQYTGNFVPVEISIRKLDNIADYWIRRNPREIQDEEGQTIKIADEIHKIYSSTDKLPTKEEIENNIDEIFMDELSSKTTMDDIVNAINELAAIVFGGE